MSKNSWQYFISDEGMLGVKMDDAHEVAWDMEGTCQDCFKYMHLVSAAPDLLEACEAFVEAWEKCLQLEKTDVALRLAKSAIAKAKGEAHEIPKSNS